MKTWVKAVWSVDKKLEQIVAALDKKIMSAALSGGGYGEALTQCHKVMRLLEVKRVTVNMRALKHAMARALGGEDIRLLEARFGEDRPLTRLAEEFGVGRFALGKMIETALGRCVEAVKEAGYGGADFEDDYGDIHIFREAYDKAEQ